MVAGDSISESAQATVAFASASCAAASASVLIIVCRTGPEACNSSDSDANGMGTKWCGAVSRDVLLALTLPNHYSLVAVLASMLPGA